MDQLDGVPRAGPGGSAGPGCARSSQTAGGKFARSKRTSSSLSCRVLPFEQFPRGSATAILAYNSQVQHHDLVSLTHSARWPICKSVVDKRIAMPGPLHGYRIVDLTSMVSGPSATMLL